MMQSKKQQNSTQGDNRISFFCCILKILICGLTICILFCKTDSLVDIYVLPKWLAGLFIAGITIPLLIVCDKRLYRDGWGI